MLLYFKRERSDNHIYYSYAIYYYKPVRATDPFGLN
jgi:hypothetical protein